MKKTFKGVALTVIGASALFLLTACGGAKSDETSEMNIEAEIIKEEMTLEIYAASGKMQNYLTEVMKVYNEENETKHKINFTTVASGTATVQMITPKLVSKEEMPDIVSITDNNAAGVLEKFEDSFYSATDYGFYKVHGDDFYQQKLNILKAQSTDNEVIPYANDFTSAFSFYQPTIFEKVGVDFLSIKSWDEYIEVAKKIKKELGIYGIALPEAGDQELFINIMSQQNVPLLDQDGNINLETEAAKNAANIIKKMIDADIVNFFGANDGEKAFQESAMFVAGGWYATNMSLNFPKASGNWRMSSLVPYSESASGKSPVSGGSSWYVPKDSKNPEVAQQFLAYILSDEDCLEVALQEGVAVSNKKAYETAAANKEFDYYGNQKYYEVLNTANDNTADAIYPASYSDATAYVTTASYNFWKTGDFEKSYVKEGENFAQKYGVEVNK